jgi:hypothetical protein
MDGKDHIAWWVANGISAGTVISTFLGWTPSVAAMVALVWYSIQIKESHTFRTWRNSRKHRLVKRLRAKIAELEVD